MTLKRMNLMKYGAIVLAMICAGFACGMAYGKECADKSEMSPGLFSDARCAAEGNRDDTVRNNDKKKVKNLKEVVVEGATRKETDEGVVFYPTSREKKFSYDAVSLLERMALPEITVLPGSAKVETMTGEPAEFFIDGKPASSRDLKALNPKDVASVEYLPMPVAANFKGKHNVVNFVMRKYEYGGYTKATAEQQLTGIGGDYNLSSKLAYRRMTYDAFVMGRYRSDHHDGASSSTDYKDFFYGGDHFDKVEETSGYRNGRVRNHGFEGSLKATYEHKDVSWANTAGWSMTATPSVSHDASTLYSPSIIDSRFYSSDNSNRIATPFYESNFTLWLPKGQMLSLYLQTSGSSGRARSFYQAQGYPAIDNESRERGYDFYFSPTYSKTFDARNSINVSTFISLKRNRVDYHGNYENIFLSRDMSGGLFFQYSHKFGSATSLRVEPGMTWKRFRQNDGHVAHDINYYPRMTINLRHKWNRKVSTSFSSILQNVGYPLEMKNGLTIRQTELLWRRGNPDLRSRLQWSNSLSNTWNPGRNYSLVSVVRYNTMFNKDYKVWLVEQGYDGLIASLSDHNTDHKISVTQKLTGRFFSRKLVLTGYASYNFLKTVGDYRKTASWWGGWLSAAWYGNSWYAYGNIVPEKTVYTGIGKTYTPWKYALGFSYTVKNLHMDLKASDFLNTSRRGGCAYIDAPHFYQRRRIYNSFAGPTYMLTLSYSLSYGKKVSDSSAGEHGTSGSSSMLIYE